MIKVPSQRVLSYSKGWAWPNQGRFVKRGGLSLRVGASVAGFEEANDYSGDTHHGEGL